MEMLLKVLITFHLIFYCHGVSLLEQLEHIARRFDADLSHMSVVLGAPTMAHHLPEAEPIMPGHTLLRPARGMLKSSVKFPHREMEFGAGVYGNVKNLGMRYDGKQERIMYSGFRRRDDVDNDLKRMQQYKANNVNNGELIGRELTPLGFIIMETPDEDVEEIVAINKEANMAEESDDNEDNEKNAEEKLNKAEWFWNTKDIFNHIKISPDAPQHTDLVPSNLDNDTKHWWFYHQDDFEPLNELK